MEEAGIPGSTSFRAWDMELSCFRSNQGFKE
jgi:hypothetical protein